MVEQGSCFCLLWTIDAFVVVVVILMTLAWWRQRAFGFAGESRRRRASLGHQPQPSLEYKHLVLFSIPTSRRFVLTDIMMG